MALRLILLALVLMGQLAQAAPCKDLLAPLPPAPLGEGEHATTFLLDSETRSGQKIVRKIYHADSQAQDQGDFQGLQFLFEHRHTFPFKVAEPLLLGTGEIYTEFIPGRNLDSVLSDLEIPSSLKDQLRARFTEKLSAAVRFFDVHGFEYQVRNLETGFGSRPLAVPISLRASKDEGTFYLEFIIKADNIIVDLKTLEMTLVDPY